MCFLNVKRLLFLTGIFLLFPHLGYCADPRGWGSTATDFMGPVVIFGDFVINACFLLGGIFFLATFIKYRQYRMNPLYVPLSTVIFLLILSILLLCLPLVHYLLGYLEHAS